MQALCPPCNLKKGSRMRAPLVLTYNREKLRPGVALALQTLLQTLGINKEVACPIVLPCRYGKSDVIRLGSLELMSAGVAAFGICMEPWLLLVDQVVRQQKVEAMRVRYDLSLGGRALQTDSFTSAKAIRGVLDKLRRGERVPEFLISMTTQLFALHCGPRYQGDEAYTGEEFLALAREVRRVYGLPLAVFVDECQYTSDTNGWGLAFQKLLDQRLILGVPLTATAERSDSRPIPGFQVEDQGEEQFNTTLFRRLPDLPPGKVQQEDYVGTKRSFLLHARYRYTDAEAAREVPPALCKTEVVRVKVKLDWLGEAVPDAAYLHEVQDLALARRLLADAIRTPRVIQEVCRAAALKLQTLRTSGMVGVAGMVYCDTDELGEESPAQPAPVRDEHLALVRGHLEAQARALGLPLDVVPITMNTPDAAGRLASFEGDPLTGQPGRGDVVLVKNMGSVGLDAPRLKVTVDLSAVRSPAAWKQRAQRGATPWAYAPERLLTNSCHITIWDPMAADNWERHFENEDIALQTCTDDVELVNKEVVDEREPEEKPTANIGDAQVWGVFHSEGCSAPAEVLAIRNNFAQQNPGLAAILAGLSDSEFFKVVQEMPDAWARASAAPPPEPEAPPAAGASNNGLLRRRYNAVFNAVCRIVTVRELERSGRPSSSYPEAAKEVAKRVKVRAGLSPGRSLEQENNADVEVHRRAARAALALAEEEGITDAEIVRNATKHWKRQAEAPPDLAFLAGLRD
jgi:hypothetical protein